MKNTGNVKEGATVSDAAALRVTIRAGVFFDGTGNNRLNSRIGADCQALMEVNGERHIRECAGRHSDLSSSYSNDLTNIARLVDLYRDQQIAANDGGGLRVYWPIYVSGAGTTSGSRDSLWPGQSFGRGPTGVVAKVERAIRKLDSRLRAFPQLNPGCVIEAIELDVFGFSRGAASARHFVNEVLKQSAGLLEPVLGSRKVRLSEDFSWKNRSVRVKVVGLFDTVAAIGSLKDLGNVSDSANRRVNLYLPPDCAQQVLHLVARDELRRNFALNSIRPVWPREIVLPGAHADIGGGYLPQMEESVMLTRPRVSTLYADDLHESTSAWLQAQAELSEMDAERWIDPLDTQASLQVQACDEQCRSRGRGSFGGRSTVIAVCLRRQVFGHLSRVHLRVMHALACDEGVPFKPIPIVQELKLPPELEGIACKLIDYARGDPYTLSDDEEKILRWRYIHHSAHWSAAIGRLGSLGDAVFVHAPEPGGRVLHPNVGQHGYPQ
ncbi:T6SS phospholipase effector Tle1-like catalytic domain-containing protein [Pseudomonas viridiflava]|uniref:T6SS phospholipase effector Tle1-like catalytic domain-containing protein n=1 Tax=Pseudomonas viridiflava TaxID=33069 RepID=UPI000F010751|nr:DUF2235 domain-containing protein [Pseudomonas viridiflava]MEE4106183.1 DUF2235 domain-containing protein [Pseudomonas viridiflava]MEE4150261.1 DUF2235 domain-containing protein [Pseudomonas viridiflava]